MLWLLGFDTLVVFFQCHLYCPVFNHLCGGGQIFTWVPVHIKSDVIPAHLGTAGIRLVKVFIS